MEAGAGAEGRGVNGAKGGAAAGVERDGGGGENGVPVDDLAEFGGKREEGKWGWGWGGGFVWHYAGAWSFVFQRERESELCNAGSEMQYHRCRDDEEEEG